MLRKFCLGNNFLMNIKENTDFLLQRPRQLASAEVIFKDRRNVFCNVNLSNLGNLLQRNVRTGRVRKCIFRASGDKFCKFFPSAPIMAAPLWAPCPCIYQSAQKNLDVLLYVYNILYVYIQYISLWPPFYKKNLYDHYYWMPTRDMLPLPQVIYKEWRMYL